MIKCAYCGSNYIIFTVYDVEALATQNIEYGLRIVCGECGASEMRMLEPPPHVFGNLFSMLCDAMPVSDSSKDGTIKGW